MRDKLAELEQEIIKTTMKLMDWGGTTPIQTYEALEEKFPQLGWCFDEGEVIKLCERIQQAELPEESKRFEALFHTFNVRYFGGRLPSYEVRVVYDVNFWSNQYFFNGVFLSQFSFGYIDRANRKIFVRRSRFRMAGYLLHEMGHAATNDEHDDPWSAEMRRLKRIGAPVFEGDLNLVSPADGDQLKFDLSIVRTAKEIFGE